MKYVATVRNLNNFKNDPFGFVVDTIIKIVVNLVIPVPLAGDIVARFKGPILGFLASIAVLVVMLFVTLIAIFVTIFTTPTGFFQFLAGNIVDNVADINNEFIQSPIPTQNPFGGTDMSFTSITAGFMDPSYLVQFGKPHTGIDLVPNSTYYLSSNTYKETKKVIIYSTHSGSANYYVDGNGGETIEVLNDSSDLKTVYIHFKIVYVNTGDKIQAGTPLGEMGGTGFATGEHLHYEIRIKDVDTWKAVNPLNYIQ